MAREFTPSASQERTIGLFGLTFDGTHAGAKAVLVAAGLPENGIPNGLTPAKAKRLSDDELRSAFGVAFVNAVAASSNGAATLQAVRDERNANDSMWRRIHQERRDAANAFARGEYVRCDDDDTQYIIAGGLAWEVE